MVAVLLVKRNLNTDCDSQLCRELLQYVLNHKQLPSTKPAVQKVKEFVSITNRVRPFDSVDEEIAKCGPNLISSFLERDFFLFVKFQNDLTHSTVLPIRRVYQIYLFYWSSEIWFWWCLGGTPIDLESNRSSPMVWVQLWYMVYLMQDSCKKVSDFVVKTFFRSCLPLFLKAFQSLKSLFK